MFYRIIRDCLIVADLVINVKLLSVYTEKNPKLKVVKDNIKETGKDFSANCKEVGKINFSYNEKRSPYSL